MTFCLFASDLHGSARRYRALAAVVERERPDAVLLGGDLLPSGWATAREASDDEDFVNGFLAGFSGQPATGSARPTRVCF